MNELQTERLRLIPLNTKALCLALADYQQMMESLGLRVTDAKLDEEMEYAMKVRLRKVLEDEENYLWLTNWAIVQKEENEITGFIMIKGTPNKNGEVIVGYGIEPQYRGKGYAAEALKGLVSWIFANPKVSRVIADTEKTNLSSHRVLEKLGAVIYNETEELFWWKLESNQSL